MKYLGNESGGHALITKQTRTCLGNDTAEEGISSAISLPRDFLCCVVTKAFPLLFHYQGIPSAVSIQRHCLYYVVAKSFPLLFRDQGIAQEIS
jgi:hypothetical protein